ncbi:efflux RND transporter permease subunit [Candidatus Williamhamiltonella defendens]|uniref:efflux RND transporter permease subunit n=1 Tax=Candidatus Williamhamiltonella defendens TaxID=138072 RepID=UPI00387EA89A
MAGSVAQHALGVRVIGSMIASTVLAIYFVPVFLWVFCSDLFKKYILIFNIQINKLIFMIDVRSKVMLNK